MNAADTANMIATDALIVAGIGAVIALAAAAFTGWQAVTAYRTRKAATERAKVDWTMGDWVEPDVIEFTSKGPDEARNVWAVVTIGGHEIEANERRVRRGAILRFRLPPELPFARLWADAEERKPRQGEASYEAEIFSYGIRMTWQSPLGRQGELPNTTGSIRRRIRDDPPTVPDGGLWGATHGPGMPL